MKHQRATCPTCAPHANSGAARRGAERARRAVAGQPTLAEVMAEENPALELLKATR